MIDSAGLRYGRGLWFGHARKHYSRPSIIRCRTNSSPMNSMKSIWLKVQICRLYVLLNSLCLAVAPLSAQDRSYGRSMVINDGGIVATSHTLASQAGAQILAHGGSAMDAAIAAYAVLGVTEPMMNGVGGDLFLLYWDAKTGKLYGLNASGWAPRKLTIEFLAKLGITAMPREGI